MRDIMLNALKSFYVGNINRHIANVEVYLRMTVGIGEHSDIVTEADKWIGVIAEAEDKLAVLNKSMPLTETRHSEYEDIDEQMR